MGGLTSSEVIPPFRVRTERLPSKLCKAVDREATLGKA